MLITIACTVGRPFRFENKTIALWQAKVKTNQLTNNKTKNALTLGAAQAPTTLAKFKKKTPK